MAWEVSDVDGVIGVLHTGNVHISWAMMLRKLIVPGNVSYTLVSGVPYDVARNTVAKKFLEANAKWLLFLDSDVLLDKDALIYLLRISDEKNLPIVSALYWRRYPPIHPAMWVYMDEKKEKYVPVNPYECKTCKQPIMNWFTASEHKKMGHEVAKKWSTGDILLVDATHMGATLIKRVVFEKLLESDPDKPFFYYTAGKYDIGYSEDFYFCKRCVEELHIKPAVVTNITANHIAHSYVNGYTGEIEFLEG